ncbi:MAG: UrcA family protein [Pseudomonadota bacterium]|nr:UrcA family protein [Pseudomonadota bacterium]
MKKPILLMFASAAVTAGLLLATPASAEPLADAATHVILVRTAGLDLSSNAGRRRLDARLARAAREVCGTASDADLNGKNDVRRCRVETLARAVTQKDALVAATERGALIAVSAAR